MWEKQLRKNTTRKKKISQPWIIIMKLMSIHKVRLVISTSILINSSSNNNNNQIRVTVGVLVA